MHRDPSLQRRIHLGPSSFSLASTENCPKTDVSVWPCPVLLYPPVTNETREPSLALCFPLEKRQRREMPAPRGSTNSTNTHSSPNTVTMAPRLPSRTADLQVRAMNKKASPHRPCTNGFSEKKGPPATPLETFRTIIRILQKLSFQL